MRRDTIMSTLAISALAAALVALLAAAPASAKPELADGLVPGQLQQTTAVNPDDRAGPRLPAPASEAVATEADDGFLGSTDAWLALTGALGLGAAAIVAARTTLRRRHRIVI